MDRGITRTLFPIALGAGVGLTVFGLGFNVWVVSGAVLITLTVAKWADEFAYWNGK